MQRRVVIVGLSVLAAGAIGGWYLFRPERLFIDDKVNEPFPVETASTAPRATSPAEDPMAMPASTEPDTTMAEPMPESSAGPKQLASGSFHSNAHETTGTATIYELQSGRRVLRLADFATSNGPDVRVYLVAAADVNDEDTVKKSGFVELGKLKGNIGAQNYDIPADVDLAKFRSVTIWCKRFSVNFGTAPLGPAKS